jgi:hypothetical protein
MPVEEDTLALLEEGRLASVQTEDRRQARYKSEDIARVAARAKDDELASVGENVREAKVKDMNDAIAARAQSTEAQISEQSGRIATLEALVAAKIATPAPIVQHETIATPPLVVHQPDPVIPLAGDIPTEGTHAV